MPGALPIRYHLTPGQTLVRALRVGLVAALLSIPVTGFLLVHGDLLWIEALLSPVVGTVATVVATPLITRGGVVLDETGIRLAHPAARRVRASWHLVTDVRAERRGGRTVPVIYLWSGRTWRLRVPYDGLMLGTDPHFDEKLCVIRNMWETYRSRRQPPGVVDENYSNTSAEG